MQDQGFSTDFIIPLPVALPTSHETGSKGVPVSRIVPSPSQQGASLGAPGQMMPETRQRMETVRAEVFALVHMRRLSMGIEWADGRDVSFDPVELCHVPTIGSQAGADKGVRASGPDFQQCAPKIRATFPSSRRTLAM